MFCNLQGNRNVKRTRNSYSLQKIVSLKVCSIDFHHILFDIFTVDTEDIRYLPFDKSP